MPPLRECREDIRSLPPRSCSAWRRRPAAAAPQVTPAALDELMRYGFPGNIASSENILERALALSASQEIGSETCGSRRRRRPWSARGHSGKRCPTTSTA